MEKASSCDRVISLTLTPRYAGSWGTWEGIRELVQNWHDGIYDAVKHYDVTTDYEIVFKQNGNNCRFLACLSVSTGEDDVILGQIIFDKFSNRLILINSSTELHKKILLLGYSGKSKDKEVIGQFGEGLKIGALALVRKGHLVSMQTCNDRWMFDLLYNEDFGEKVLTILVSDRATGTYSVTSEKLVEMMDSLKPSDTCTTVTGLTVEDWNCFLPRFLFLQPPENFVKTEIGTLLLDEHLSGQLYVKGLWVSDLSKEDLAAGVNILSLQLDRDRNAVPKPSEIDHLLSCIWIKAVERKPELYSQYFKLLKNEKYRDVRHAVEYSSDIVAQEIAKQFLGEFGAFAFPVLNSSTMEEISSVQEELRLTAILCNKTLLDILLKSGSYKDLNIALENHRTKQHKNVPFFLLTNEELVVMETVTKLLKMVNIRLDTSMMDVIETSPKEVCCSTDGGERVMVPRWYLDKQQVHKAGKLCSTDDTQKTQCFCRELRLCTSLLRVHHKSFAANPKILIPDLHSPSTKFEDEVLLQLLHKMLSQIKTSQGVENKNADTCQDSEIKGVSSRQELDVFVARETKYLQKIQSLEAELDAEKQSHSKTLTNVTQQLKKVEKELIAKEVSLLNEEDDIRKRYEDQLNVYKNRAENAVKDMQKLITDRDMQILNLKQSVQHKEHLLTDYSTQIDEMTLAAEKRSEALLEELSHYISQNSSRTKSLSRLCAEKYEAAAQSNQDNKDKWLLLKDLCDIILEDLQREKIFCSVCLLKRKCCVLQPCGHYCLCEDCAKHLKFTSNHCPLCKLATVSYLRVYE